MTPALVLKDVSATYGHGAILHGIDFEVPGGQVTALLGANGAGKTTTLRAICGMIQTSGEISLFGEDICGRKPEEIARMGVAHVPDGRGTFSGLSVMDNLRFIYRKRSLQFWSNFGTRLWILSSPRGKKETARRNAVGR